MDGMANLADGTAIARLIDAGIERFGKLDAACVRTGEIIGGRFMDAALEQLQRLQAVNQEAVFHSLQALLKVMVPAAARPDRHRDLGDAAPSARCSFVCLDPRWCQHDGQGCCP